MKSLLDNYCIWCKITTFLLDNYQKRLFFGLFYDLEVWDFILIFAPNPRGHSSICKPKTVRFIPTRLKLDLTFGQLTISCQKAANQRGKEFLFDYRLYLRKCSWGRKITIKMQIPLGAGTDVQIRTRKNRIIWGQYVEPNISKPIRETHEQR